jgi:pimeloyl-[acyl-carrier protein] methyl ester esterase
MNSHVWTPIRQALLELGQVTYIDLPGHGVNQALTLGTLNQAIERISPSIPYNASLIGWSLGGLIAQALAQSNPERVQALSLIASTPKFVNDAQWSHGLAPEVLQTFANNLQSDYVGTVKRFFALQFLGLKADNKAVNQLRETIMAAPASPAALADGLAILGSADFTNQPVKQPTQWLLGRLDKLIPVSLAEALPTMGYTHINVLPNAAHVPFVTHPELFMQTLRAFLHAH